MRERARTLAARFFRPRVRLSGRLLAVLALAGLVAGLAAGSLATWRAPHSALPLAAGSDLAGAARSQTAPGANAFAPSSPPGQAAGPVTLPAPAEEPGRETREAAAPIAHTVREGETLSEIAEQYGVSEDSIVWANDGLVDRDFLKVGQTLTVPPLTGILHTVEDGDTLLAVAALYDVEMEDVAAANALAEPYALALGQLLIVPDGKLPEPEPAPVLVAMAIPERAAPSARGEAPAARVVPAPAPPAGLSAERGAFVAKLIGPAQRSMRETGVPASVTVAQAIWEADWGRSGLAAKANNYFGIKGRPTPGPAGVIWLTTWEHVNGRDVTVKEPFKAYNSLEESVLDHGVLLSTNSRYAGAMRNADDPKTFIRLVHEAGYATDPAYTDKIVNLMDRYNLYVYDEV